MRLRNVFRDAGRQQRQDKLVPDDEGDDGDGSDGEGFFQGRHMSLGLCQARARRWKLTEWLSPQLSVAGRGDSPDRVPVTHCEPTLKRLPRKRFLNRWHR